MDRGMSIIRMFLMVVFCIQCTTIFAQQPGGGPEGGGPEREPGKEEPGKEEPGKEENVRLNLTISPTSGGSVTCDKEELKRNDTATFVATANEGYRFVKWRSGDRDYSDQATITIEGLPRELRLTAIFELITYTINVSVSDENGGSISSNKQGNQFVPSDTVTFTATPNCGYHFSHWEGDEADVTEGNTIRMNGVTEDHSFTAVFEKESDYVPAISISEIMPCNLSTYMDSDYYNFSGFVEFANSGTCRENLKSYTITHYKLKKKGKYSLKWEWEIQQDYYVEPESRNLLWFDGQYTGKADKNSKNAHSPYKLDADGGYILISSREGVIIDSIAYGKMDAHVSFGRDESGTIGYMDPSPRQANSQAFETLTEDDRCVTVDFSETGGIKEGAFKLALTCDTKGAEIYYTIDGSEPNKTTGTRYDSLISIGKNTCVRARAFHANKLTSAITTHSYIFSDDTHEKCGGLTIPIVSLTVENDYFYDDMIGIYITGKNGIQGDKNCSGYGNYNQDWQRPLNFEYIVDGKQEVSREVESSIVGGCSITETIKSLSLKTSKQTGKEYYDYAFFASKPDINHKTIHLRNGGSDHKGLRFRDGIMQTFAIGMNIDYQAYQPVAYYLNGKYMGLMNLNERTNADYVTSNYGIDEDDIDLVVISDQKGIYASKGDVEAYNELVDYLSGSAPEDENYFAGACERMDMDEYIDYQIIQQFMVNMDWPGNNTKIWRERKEGSKFRWILFDMDYGLGLYNYKNYKTNMIKWCQGEDASYNWATKKDWMTKIFANLSKNPEFKKKFYLRFMEQLETTFSQERIATVFDSITTMIDEEFCATKGQTATSAAKSIKEYAMNRPEVIKEQLREFLGDKAAEELERGVTGESLSLANTISLYPTIVSDIVEIHSGEEIESVRIVSLSGIAMLEEQVNSSHYQKDLSALPAGIYYVTINTAGTIQTKKIIKAGAKSSPAL